MSSDLRELDAETRRRGDAATEDAETRRRGDAEKDLACGGPSELPASPRPRVSASNPPPRRVRPTGAMLTIEQVAAELGVGIDKVMDLIDTRVPTDRLTAVDLSVPRGARKRRYRRLRVRRADLERFLTAHIYQPAGSEDSRRRRRADGQRAAYRRIV